MRVRRGEQNVELDFRLKRRELEEARRALRILEQFTTNLRREVEEAKKRRPTLFDVATEVFERKGRVIAEGMSDLLRQGEVFDFSEDTANGDGHLDALIFRAVVREGTNARFEVMYDAEQDEATLGFVSVVEE